MARYDRACAALGDRKRRLGFVTYCKLHAMHVHRFPTLCLVLGWVLRYREALDTVPQANRQLLDRAKFTRIETCTASSVGRERRNHNPRMRQRGFHRAGSIC